MSIVTIHLPGSGVNYGKSQIRADANGNVEVPGYVAATLLELPGVTGPEQGGTPLELIKEPADAFEFNYIFAANGLPNPPADDRQADAIVLMSLGVPAASLIE